MNKQNFIDRLYWFWGYEGDELPDEYGHPNYSTAVGEVTLAGLLARWIEKSGDSDDEFDNFTRRLPHMVVEAFSEISKDPRWQEERQAYRQETGRDIPDLVDAHAGGIHRILVVARLCRLIPLLTGDAQLRAELESTLNAQQRVIDHAWRRFVTVGYRTLMPRITVELHRGNSGVFGSTRLSTFALAGRVSFTFRRDTGTMTYVADASDMYGGRSGADIPGAPYAECVAMIEDVIQHWDPDKLEPVRAG
jgi:hypothetical protein